MAVVLSVREDEKLTALNIREFQAFCDRAAERAAARGMTEEILDEILSDRP